MTFAAFILLILAIALAVAAIGVVVLALNGRASRLLPHVAGRAAALADHLNGDAEPPAPFVHALDQGRAQARDAAASVHKLATRAHVSRQHA